MTPPIPPGCERFICERDGRLEAALVFPLDFAAHPATEPFNAHQRLIVAAYCEVAWLKEAERMAEKHQETGSIREEIARMRAREAAHDWREWGEGK